ncbi:hypothetical protein C8F01DRAFT_505065 [Mycena amicta]|nr:hypothetical protein C8F01DRAFT_505065 [Mycena amicta]
MLFDQLTQILGHCLVRLSQSAEAAQRIFATSVIRVIKVVVAPIQLLPTSTATSSQPSLPPAPVLLPTKSFPVLIAGTPALGSGIYQAPTASFALCILSVAISVMLVYGALKRLGFAERLEKVVKSSLMTTLVQVCIAIATDRYCVTHTSILLASEYGKVFAHRAFTSGTSQLSFPVLASLPSGPTKTYLVPIAGSPSLGSVYQIPQTAAALFVLSGVSSVLLLYGAAIRLGATETAPDIFGAFVSICSPTPSSSSHPLQTRTVCSVASLGTSIVTIATKSARRRVTSTLFFVR